MCSPMYLSCRTQGPDHLPHRYALYLCLSRSFSWRGNRGQAESAVALCCLSCKGSGFMSPREAHREVYKAYHEKHNIKSTDLFTCVAGPDVKCVWIKHDTVKQDKDG